MSELPTTDDELTGEPFERPPGEHASELPSDDDASDASDASGRQAENAQEENAQTSEDQPSQ